MFVYTEKDELLTCGHNVEKLLMTNMNSNLASAKCILLGFSCS